MFGAAPVRSLNRLSKLGWRRSCPSRMIRRRRRLVQLEAQRFDVVDHGKQTSHLDRPRCKAKFSCLLERIDGISAGVAQHDNIRLGSLSLQKETRSSPQYAAT